MNLRVLLSVLLAAALLPTLAVAGPASAADEVVLTWPEVTDFNYGTTDYVVHAETADLTGLRVTVNGHDPQPVDAAGDLHPRFVKGGRQVVNVLRCTTTCVQVDYRVVTAFTEFEANLAYNVRQAPEFGPRKALDVTYVVTPAGIAATQSWAVVDPGATQAEDQVLATGQSTFSTDDPARLGPVTLPAGTPDGAYELRVNLTGESGTYGSLDRDLDPVPVTWDTTGDRGHLTFSGSVIYPEKDGYLDTVRMNVTGRNPVVVITDPDGTQRARYERLNDRAHFDWTPARKLPGGTYDVTLTTSDDADNLATVVKHLEVRTGHLGWRTGRAVLRASRTVVDRNVGSCSTLSSPAQGGPAGSLGYYSQTRCTRADDSAVVTVNAASLPKSFDGTYRDLQVTVNGGGANGARNAYAVLYYYDAKAEKYDDRRQLSAASGTHPGPTIAKPARQVVDPTKKPHFYWSLGLSEGSRYDVRSFTVSVRYLALVG